MTETIAESHPTIAARLREAITNALRYWEPRRLVFNLVLTGVVLAYFAAAWPQSREAVTLNGVLVFFILAVLANVCYCAAYLGDILVQFSGFSDLWRRWRWGLFVLGTAFAAAITRFFALGGS